MSIVALIESLVNGLLEAEENFFLNPKEFGLLEGRVKSTTESFAASFLSEVLSRLDEQIRKDGWRDGRYKVQRREKRTLISSVGDLSFECTYYESIKEPGHYVSLLGRVVGLERNERFTEQAETMLLNEAIQTSYERASNILPSRSMITKTTVMNKVHGITEKLPTAVADNIKQVSYLYIEADEDHLSEQHGRWGNKERNKSFISRLAYLYEYKKDDPCCKGRKSLVNVKYFGGLYPGGEGIRRFWEEIESYIAAHYDQETLKRVYISGDGAEGLPLNKIEK